MKVFLTGGSGFIGRALIKELHQKWPLNVAMRRNLSDLPPNCTYFPIDDISQSTEFSLALSGCDAVIHAAARVHVLGETATDPLSEYRRVNVAGTLNLAAQAARAGIRRFVFISSIKVNGESTAPARPFQPDDAPNPQDDYGISKLEAELGLRRVGAQTGMEIVIVRPPLVYGEGVTANFGALMRAVGRGIPLPLGAIQNQRSLVALENLTSFISTCVTHPNAVNQVFFVSDGEDLSTPELIRGIASATGRPARLIPIPIWLLKTVCTAIGKGDLIQRLCGNLQVDLSKSREVLGWKPSISVAEGLRQAVAGNAHR